jgi:hypothetical protein
LRVLAPAVPGWSGCAGLVVDVVRRPAGGISSRGSLGRDAERRQQVAVRVAVRKVVIRGRD